MPETSVVESPATLVADVTSAVVRAGMTAASEVDRAKTSAPPTTGGEGGDLCTSGPQAAMEEGMKLEDDQHQCLYVGTLWEAEVVADRHDLDEFKEASRAIGRVLSVRAFVELLRFLLRVFECREG
jgi:hypothetical protein